MILSVKRNKFNLHRSSFNCGVDFFKEIVEKHLPTY